ncbi:hypothetical protein CBM2626_A230001 [Cupriavidus taiwanensis]|nr:hypothetical protein CBM2626_A230001 [Cupriavidus taiwanensis]
MHRPSGSQTAGRLCKPAWALPLGHPDNNPFA